MACIKEKKEERRTYNISKKKKGSINFHRENPCNQKIY